MDERFKVHVMQTSVWMKWKKPRNAGRQKKKKSPGSGGLTSHFCRHFSERPDFPYVKRNI